jgi:hypothetical protein
MSCVYCSDKKSITIPNEIYGSMETIDCPFCFKTQFQMIPSEFSSHFPSQFQHDKKHTRIIVG